MLAPAVTFAPPEPPDLSGIRRRLGDFEQTALSDRMSDSAIVGDAIEHYKRLSPQLPGLVYAARRAIRNWSPRPSLWPAMPRATSTARPRRPSPRRRSTQLVRHRRYPPRPRAPSARLSPGAEIPRQAGAASHHGERRMTPLTGLPQRGRGRQSAAAAASYGAELAEFCAVIIQINSRHSIFGCRHAAGATS